MLGSPYGWAREAAEGLCEAMTARGHSVDILTTNASWPTIAESPSCRLTGWTGGTLQICPVDGWVATSRRRLLRTFAFSRRFRAEIRQRARLYDVIHIHMLYTFPTLAAAEAAARARVPFVISPHGSLDPYQHFRQGHLRKELFLRLFKGRVLDRAALIHFVSDRERELAQRFDITANAAVVNLAIRTEPYEYTASSRALREAHPELNGRRIVMYLGRLSYTKGLDLLVYAFAKIARYVPDAHLLIVGPDYENYGKQLKNLLEGEGLGNRATFTGPVSEADKIAALKIAEVFVLPSKTEAFGLVLLEAMASRVAIVTTDQAALASELAAADAAIVARDDSDALAEAIQVLLGDAGERQRVAEAGYQLVKRRFTWQNSADALIARYHSTISKN